MTESNIIQFIPRPNPNRMTARELEEMAEAIMTSAFFGGETTVFGVLGPCESATLSAADLPPIPSPGKDSA